MLRCVAIDDEPLALAQLAGYIKKVPFLELVDSCRDAFSALNILSKTNIDLVFVDINMPDLNGLDFVKSLTYKPIIIFTTAYSEYALDGFRVDALDYLLKPFSYKDFLHSANKAQQHYEMMNFSKESPAKSQPAIMPETEFIFVKADYKIVKIKTSEIKYIESQSEYVKIFPQNEKPIMTLLSLKSLEERLPDSMFMRVHRSYIVNLSLVREVSRAGIVFDTKLIIPIGEQYRDKFNDYINQHSLIKH
jgi:DNA-binding LytR/AlgR family response regulator